MFSSIPDGTLEKFSTFGDLLRYLRRRAGITQLELSIAVGYSNAQISRLEQGLRLPDIPTIEARFVPALGIADEPKTILRLLDLAANVRREDAPGVGLCPYKGLNYFDECDVDLFSGREALTARLEQRVLSLVSGGDAGKARFLAIVGASGSGKSSLVRASLVPVLRWNKTSTNWPIQVFTPTAHPLESLAATLTEETGSVAAIASLMDDMARDRRSLNLFLKRALKSTDASYFLLVIDQFEELFALCRSEDERTAFIDNLITATFDLDGPAVAIVTLRADFYAYCARYPYLREAVARNQEYIGVMSDKELRRAIEEPAFRGRWDFEPGLVDLLLHDVGAYAGHTPEPGALPLLSHALMEIWLRRRGRTMTLSGYVSSGGVRGAIAETAEAIFTDRLTDGEQAIARRIFLRLIKLGDENLTGDTRRRAALSELVLKPEEVVATLNVLTALADARLITTGEDTVEVAHEALVREWPRLRGWLEDNREGLRLHWHLTEAAKDWVALNREAEGLYRGARLAQAREWALTHADEMNALEREFLDASLALSEHEAAEKELQRQREMQAAQKLAEMALVALSFGSLARQAAVTAQYQQRVAISRELAAAAINNLEVDPERSILLAMHAVLETYSVDNSWTLEAEDALRRSLLVSRLQLTLRGHTSRVWGVAFSPDGRLLATQGEEGTAVVWDAVTGDSLLTLPTGNTHGYLRITFSPDGGRLLTPGELGAAIVWDAQTGQELLKLEGHTEWVSAVAFSPDGTRLATASSDRMVKVWDAATGQELLTLRGHTSGVWGVAFTPEGEQLLSASHDGEVKVWEAITGEQRSALVSQSSPIISMALSSDGTRLATGSIDCTVKLWDTTTGELLLTLLGHPSSITGVAFNPDGTHLATAGIDGNVKVWDTATGQGLFTLSGHTDQVVGVAFSPDCVRIPGARAGQCGGRLATSSWDGTVKVWNASDNRELLTLSNPDITSASISPDWTRLATGDRDGRVGVWDLSTALLESTPEAEFSETTATEILSSGNHAAAVNVIAFDQAGTRLVTASEDYTAKVWDVEAGTEWQTFIHAAGVHAVDIHLSAMRLATSSKDSYAIKIWDLTTGQAIATILTAKIHSIGFNPDGTSVAAGTADGTVKVWGAVNGDERLTLSGHSDWVNDITFSPDGMRLATASDDGTAKVWDAVAGQELLVLPGHTGGAKSIAISPDGSRLATASQDGTVRLWDMSDGQQIHMLSGHGVPITSIIFSPDGGRMVTIGEGIFRFYLLRIEDLLSLARRRVTRDLSPAECQRYLHLALEQCTAESEADVQNPVAETSSASIPGSSPAGRGKVCEITDTNGIHDRFFNQQTYQALLQVSKQFGWSVVVREPVRPDEIKLFLTELTQSGCDLIVAPTSNSFPELFINIADANTQQKFQIMEWGYNQLRDNVWRQTFEVDQAAFLAGYVAASVTRTEKIGTFGGMKFFSVISFMDGFALGAAYYNEVHGTNIQVLGWDVEKRDGLFIGNFVRTVDGRVMGERLLDQGVDIILPVAAGVGLGTAEAAKERGNAYIIGVDSDWVVMYPDYADIILTSILKRSDLSVISAVQSIVEGTFTGGTHAGTLGTGVVDIAPFHNLDVLVSPEIKADLEQIKKDIITGKIITTLDTVR